MALRFSVARRLGELEKLVDQQKDSLYTIVLKGGRVIPDCDECLLESFIWNPDRHGLLQEVIADDPANQGVADMLYFGLSQEEGMDVNELQRRLDKLEADLARKGDPVFTITTKDGTTHQCDYEHAWGYFQDGRDDVVSVVVDRDDYAEVAALLERLCKS